MAGLVFVFGTEQRLECVVAAFRADAGYGVKFFFGTLKIHYITHGGYTYHTRPRRRLEGGGIEIDAGAEFRRFLRFLMHASREHLRITGICALSP